MSQTQITYEIEIEDLVKYNLYTLRSNRHTRRNLLIVRITVALVLMMLSFLSISVRGITWLDIIIWVFVLVYFLYAPIFHRGFIARAVRKAHPPEESRGTLGRHTITLTTNGLREESETGESSTLWRGISKISSNDQYIFFYLNPNLAHVVPRRAFPSDEDAERFLETARALQDAARIDTPPS
jgi:hypothetical protein